MTNKHFLELMKKDLMRFRVERKDDVVNKGEPKELTEAMRWVRNPLTPAIVTLYAKQYRLSEVEFEEYAHRFKTFYEGK